MDATIFCHHIWVSIFGSGIESTHYAVQRKDVEDQKGRDAGSISRLWEASLGCYLRYGGLSYGRLRGGPSVRPTTIPEMGVEPYNYNCILMPLQLDPG